MNWSGRKIKAIKSKLTSIENYCDSVLLSNKDVRYDSFYGGEKEAIKKLRKEIVSAHNNFRSELDV